VLAQEFNPIACTRASQFQPANWPIDPQELAHLQQQRFYCQKTTNIFMLYEMARMIFNGCLYLNHHSYLFS